MLDKKIVITMAASTLALVGCTVQSTSEPVDIVGKWNIEKAMNVTTEKATNPTFINFDKDGSVNGNASVNLFKGTYKLNGDSLKISDIGMTMMMGPSMDVEDAVTKALNTTALVKAENGKLYVFNETNDTIMVLAK